MYKRFHTDFGPWRHCVLCCICIIYIATPCCCSLCSNTLRCAARLAMSHQAAEKAAFLCVKAAPGLQQTSRNVQALGTHCVQLDRSQVLSTQGLLVCLTLSRGESGCHCNTSWRCAASTNNVTVVQKGLCSVSAVVLDPVGSNFLAVRLWSGLLFAFGTVALMSAAEMIVYTCLTVYMSIWCHSKDTIWLQTTFQGILHHHVIKL